MSCRTKNLWSSNKQTLSDFLIFSVTISGCKMPLFVILSQPYEAEGWSRQLVCVSRFCTVSALLDGRRGCCTQQAVKTMSHTVNSSTRRLENREEQWRRKNKLIHPGNDVAKWAAIACRLYTVNAVYRDRSSSGASLQQRSSFTRRHAPSIIQAELFHHKSKSIFKRNGWKTFCSREKKIPSRNVMMCAGHFWPEPLGCLAGFIMGALRTHFFLLFKVLVWSWPSFLLELWESKKWHSDFA